MIQSLKGRLILGTAIVITAGMLMAGLAVYGFSRSALYNQFDASLRATVQVMALLAEENEHGGVEFESASLGYEEFVRNERPSYYQLWHDGKILAKSKHLAKANLASESGTLSDPKFTFIRLPDGRRGRQISATFRPRLALDSDQGIELFDDDFESQSNAEQVRGDVTEELVSNDAHDGFNSDRALILTVNREAVATHESGVMTLVWERLDPAVTIVVARDTMGIEQPLETLRWVLLAVGSSVTLICVGLLLVVVQRGLQPINSVSSSIAQIDATSLEKRIATANVPREVAPIVSRLNELLARLEAAFHRERDFSSNIAHELRTPLAGLRSTLEVYLSRDHDQSEYQAGFAACLQICEQSENLVENLLSLARIEGNGIQTSRECFCLDGLLHDCWERFRETAETKGLQVDFDVRNNVKVNSDREIMRVILRNLIGNAVSHCDHAGRVRVSLTESPTRVQIENTGNQISGQQLHHVFDRLWRGDRARACTGEHFGLGLTLARRFAELLDCHLHVSVDGDLFKVEFVVVA